MHVCDQDDVPSDENCDCCDTDEPIKDGTSIFINVYVCKKSRKPLSINLNMSDQCHDENYQNSHVMNTDQKGKPFLVQMQKNPGAWPVHARPYKIRDAAYTREFPAENAEVKDGSVDDGRKYFDFGILNSDNER